MKLSFHGAARTVTGSKHIIHLDSGKKILLDCGMFQGMGKETVDLNTHWGFDPKEIYVVIISHAHIDHIGLLPKLVKDGFAGKIYCTSASIGLIKLLLEDSANIQEADISYTNKERARQHKHPVEPLYTLEDAQSVFPLLEPVPYNETEVIDEEISLLYTDCGHILGSAAAHVQIHDNGKKTQITFSGDLGRYRDVILRSPEVFPQADYIIMESTYGDKLHDSASTTTEALLEHITHTCLEKKGKLIIPSFSLGRTQELLYLLNKLELENRLPKLPYYVDSPLSIRITEVVKQHPECFNKHVRRLLEKDNDVFAFKGLHYIRSVEESIRLNTLPEPCVIISASGMAEAGRVKHHIKNSLLSPRNTILIVGYCEPNSLGGRLKNGDKEVRIFGVLYPVKAEVAAIDTMSAHGDYHDLSQWLACQDPQLVKKLFLVHGEYDVQQNFREKLIRKGFLDVMIPNQHEVIGLGDI
jgi:metallo-beta-lactamase family protein